MMENQRNNHPEWIIDEGDIGSDESGFSGYSEDDIDSDRAYSSENDDSGSNGEQENEPDQGWEVNPSFLDQYHEPMFSWVQIQMS